MTLALDMKKMSMHYISYKHCASITKAISVDWKGTLYCSTTLKWDYRQRTCELSMPGYVQQAVEKFQHGIKSPNKAIDTPHPYKAMKK